MKTKSIGLSLAALAVVVTPVAASALNPESTTLTATVNSNISMTGSTAVGLALTPTSGSVQSIQSGTYSVTTNNSSGYNLKIKDSDATLNLTAGGGTFTPGSGTQAAPVALTDGKWGWAVAGGAFDATYTTGDSMAVTTKKFAGITASDVQLKSTGTTASGDNTVIYYSAQAGTAQPTGAYTDTVVVTATANP